jgi:Flp pilus assembly protein TadG
MSLNIARRSGAVSVAARPSGGTRRFGRRRDRGGMAVMCAVMVPVLIGFGTLAINQGYVTYRGQLLRQTVQAAALAAADNLSSYYSTGSSSAVITAAQTFATANMPSAQYGTVVPSSDVVLGTWNASTNSFTAGGSTPNAVQVTGINTAANGNAVSLFFGSLFGKPSVDMTSTAVASYVSSGSGTGSGSGGSGSGGSGGGGSGTGVSNGRMFNTIVINDMSQSFAGEISDQVAADLAILNCVQGQTGTTSQFGITFINGHAYTYQALEPANANNLALQAKINLITQCTALEDPNCGTGSNVASGLYSAVQQFSGSTFTGQSKNIVIITDGAPNAKNGVDYTTADGVSCGRSCTDQDLLTAAQSLAATAKAAGISISTIYYSGDDTNPTDQANYKAFLASLVTNSGLALVAPTAAQIDSSYSGVCSTIPSSVKTSS